VTAQPALFIGHGSPLQAIEPSRFTAAAAAHGRVVPRPRTIHDFYGFPPALYALQYPAPGDPQLAAQVAKLLVPTAVRLDEEWGLDHGSWSVLRYMYPRADIPVVQLSLDAALSGPQHYALAQRLAPLRDAGVLVLGSGNVVHNLRMLQADPAAAAPPWAQSFSAAVRARVQAGQHPSLAAYESLDAGAALSVPTPEHYLPLLYALALVRAGDAVSMPIDGMELGSLSMLSVLIGGA